MFGFIKKVRRAVALAKVPRIHNPVNAAELFARPKPGGKKASPAGVKLKVPKQLPPTASPEDPLTKELRVFPRKLSTLADQLENPRSRKRKPRD
jgi:hypothetical protein